ALTPPPPPSPPSPSASASASATAAAEAGPSACPAGMALVDGDYCTELELTCKKSWYAKWNDKTICDAFEEPSKCDGRRVHKRFCMDLYEYPNKKGERPQVMFKFGAAQHLCAAQGKRVCTETEWTMACEGPSYKPYPYGYARDPKICNGDRQYVEPTVAAHDKKGLPIFAFASKKPDVAQPELERLWQGVESGSQPECVSDYGLWDMPGNADELASSETPEPVSKFDNVTTGGPWLYGVRNQCRPKIYTHDEGFAYYYLSTRCCAEADGAVTDPRAPKQIKRKETWR
ncbi:MAG: SUMF1/EgtB/PvdO family nonheme iron enzyme, partial [Polyangiaceae bacterium]